MAQLGIVMTHPDVIGFDSATGLKQDSPIGLPRWIQRLQANKRERTWLLTQHFFDI
jgi:hypothetical protein